LYLEPVLDNESTNGSTGGIIGGAVAGLFVIMLLVAAVFIGLYVVKQRYKNKTYYPIRLSINNG